MKRPVFSSVLVGVASFLITQSVRAQPLLDIVEHSSTSLTATFDGSPLSVTLLQPDDWLIAKPAQIALSTFIGTWIEPDNQNSFNSISSLVSLEVSSDTSSPLGSAFPDGTFIFDQIVGRAIH